MRMSCNGCRVLRKGCTEDCILRPCLQWIKSSDCQANATLFLAKFYGRAGLINLINAGPDHLRPAIFKSLLYEACGRIINPMYGSVGLLWAGKWHHCQSAVDAVLKGSPIACEDATASTHPILPLKGCDIRHVSKDLGDLHRIRSRPERFKRSGGLGKPLVNSALQFHTEPTQFSVWGWDRDCWEGPNRTPSNDSSVFSGETVEASERVKRETHIDEGEVGLELTLGFNPVLHHDLSAAERVVIEVSDSDA